MVFYKNGKTGLNGEHSWADVPVLSHLWEVRNVKQGRGGSFHLILRKSLMRAIYVRVSQWAMATECFQLGYNAEGHCKGEADPSIPEPQKLNWEIPSEVSQTIDE